VKARIWGCRGSLASPGPNTVGYGGNTSCIEVKVDDDHLIILDAGSGIRDLGVRLMGESPQAIHIVLSHLHLDHLQGLAFFPPFWSADVELHIWGPASPTRSLAERVAGYLSPPLFPVHLSDAPSRPIFHDVPQEPFMIGNALVRGTPVSHQGPTVGIRVEADDRVLAYLPDHEPSLGIDLASLEPEWISGHAVARDADVLLHDAQYSATEYHSHVGWGHSSIDHAVAFALASNVHRLVLFHHDPGHTDAHLEIMCAEAAAKWTADSPPPVLAAEGTTFTMGPEGVSLERASEHDRPLSLA
jgi:phosphoribosyl 1,2-cyclic phosphodiesterase